MTRESLLGDAAALAFRVSPSPAKLEMKLTHGRGRAERIRNLWAELLDSIKLHPTLHVHFWSLHVLYPSRHYGMSVIAKG
jgi:hypothetical protein